MTKIAMVVDKSGSMDVIKNDAIGAFNSFLDGQKQEGKGDEIEVILFDTVYKTMYRGDLHGCPLMDGKRFVPDGLTAMLDAIGSTLDRMLGEWDNEPAPKPGVVMAILTDGEENSSKEYDIIKIRQRIQHCRSLGWEFIFLGANIDAKAYADKLGIDPTKAFGYAATGAGIRDAYATTAVAVSAYRKQKKSLPR